MRIWNENSTGYVEIVRTEPYFPENTQAEFVASVQSRGCSGRAVSWFKKSSLMGFQRELEQLDQTRQGECTLTGYDQDAQTVCVLTIRALDRVGHLGLSIALTSHLDSDMFSEDHVRTGFTLDPGVLLAVAAEIGQLMDGSLTKPDDYEKDAQPLDPSWPGLDWRFLARDWRRPMRQVYHLTGDGWTWFDELVVGDWFHMEWMNGRHWWMRVGDARISVTIPKGKPAIVTVERDNYEQRLSPEEEAKAIEEGDVGRDPFGVDEDDQ